jgi:uncharacterized protein
MFQTWSELLFLHWALDASEIQNTLPPGLYVDTHEGQAWLGVVPFFMRNIRPRFCPAVPWLSHFMELNLRTYVHDEKGRPGVWFYSLDCNQPVAVWTARTFFHLPYRHAKMTASRESSGHRLYGSQLSGQVTTSEFSYQLANSTRLAIPGTLDFFLAERYLLFSQTPHGLACGQVHHEPYPLAEVDLKHWDAHIIALGGFSLPSQPPDHVIGSPGVDVSVFALH